MKNLYWLLCVLLVPVYLFISFFFNLTAVLGGYGGSLKPFNDFIMIGGGLTSIVGIAGIVVGCFIFVKKKNTKRAVICAFIGLLYGMVFFGGMFVLEQVHTIQFAAQIEEKNKELYGENWNTQGQIDALPELYEVILNQYYVIVKDAWDTESIKRTLYSAYTMPEYYGTNGLENIGFTLMDLNGDHYDELLIGQVSDDPNEATLILMVYADETNPFELFSGVEGEIYYLHFGQEGRYHVEIAGETFHGTVASGYWALTQGGDGELLPSIQYCEKPLDSANRLPIELTPFAEYY